MFRQNSIGDVSLVKSELRENLTEKKTQEKIEAD